ncbi:TIGR03620 family F420-dependent LLM class oxidoreductase [Nucisporomicrobium flavum]|uniref:TIGR03620 family F420-dependent LLM class oxidoreductase n=1 Tax=Nucisporomicrobium flavum TaxID=2785915 RepID=UPI0018F4052A|nr:TIGR03620 family F420-dependent LLM class oxidoreductase [Nucisporomicrobium flavum]
MNEIGRFGLWISGRHWPADPAAIAEAAAEIEALGYGSVWIGGSPADDLALPEAVLAATTRLVVGTSIVDIWRSDPKTLSAATARLRSAFPGRFYLGLGMGHAPAVEATGRQYVRPLSKLRAFLADLVDVPAEERLLAALGPKALELASTSAAGALPYLVPAAHTADARRILGPDKLLIPEQKIFLGSDPATARTVGRRGTAIYLNLPNYTNNLRRYGLTDDDFAGEGSDRWVNTLVAWGDDEMVRARVEEHFTAGADHVALQVLSANPAPQLPMPEIRAAARIFLS